MVLIHFNRTGHLSLLADLWPDGAITPEVIRECEIGDATSHHPENKRILEAVWIRAVAVDDPADVRYAMNLRRAWHSAPDKDRGEADIVVLCRRNGWIAISDDNNGRAALEHTGCDFSYMASMLVAAAATGHAGLDLTSAWEVHQALQDSRVRPHIDTKEKFAACVKLANRLHTQIGSPAWPGILRDPRVDLMIEKFDGRRLSRRTRPSSG
ncbi:MAG: hypothetical protein HY827_06680 [Actinobacteria bacterium]|nr:hypothetical protein [Actinomycetota bacterium]